MSAELRQLAVSGWIFDDVKGVNDQPIPPSVLAQLRRYHASARSARMKHAIIEASGLVVSAAIPALAAFGADSRVIAVFGSLAVLIGGVRALASYKENWTSRTGGLGHDKAAVRLAGVYALARIADDSVRDRPTCLEVLCAYLRMPYDPDDPAAEAAERQVRTTAQTAIAARLRPDHPGFWADAQIDLAGAYLVEPRFARITAASFNATTATFNGDARFDGATFNEYAAFGRATFNGHAVFGEVTFSRDAVFGGATFSGHAGFGGATFSRDHPPVWPDGFGGAAGIVWEPEGPPDPDPQADPADPPTGP
jgi:hypothetical protein